MKRLISALLLMLILAGTTTVFAAKDSLPTEPLYGVKTFLEDTRLSLTTDPIRQMDRLLEMAQVRIREMSMLVDQQEDVPEKVAQRLHLHIENALQLAAGQDDAEMQGSLLKIQARLQIQEQVMTQLQARASQASQPVLERARIRTQEQMDAVNQGLTDPFVFRNRYRAQNSNAYGTPTPGSSGQSTEEPAQNSAGPGPGPIAQDTPDAGFGPNSTPVSGYGPNPTPGTGYGPNPTQEPGYGPNPTPGTGYGPNPTQEPGYGPNPTPDGGTPSNPPPGGGGKP